jgi:hypothetical protein
MSGGASARTFDVVEDVVDDDAVDSASTTATAAISKRPGGDSDLSTSMTPTAVPNGLGVVSKDVEWRKEHEDIFMEWCDKAMCYRWLHRKCNTYYTRYNAWFTIPVIVMSTITGTTNFATEYFAEDVRKYVPLVIGSVNILAGIVGTVHQFLKVSEINEAHRVSYILWDKFYRNIRLELCKKPEERLLVSDMLRYSKEEYDRLIETSPRIADSVIAEFNRTFEGESFAIPEVCDHLRGVKEKLYVEAEPAHLSKAGVSFGECDVCVA